MLLPFYALVSTKTKIADLSFFIFLQEKLYNFYNNIQFQ